MVTWQTERLPGSGDFHTNAADAELHSICITNFNSVKTLRKSLDSVLGQLDDRFEVVVVDQGSYDGSLEILTSYERQGSIHVFQQRVRNRGLGRQLAFEKSKGLYVISNIDMDDTYEPKLAELTQRYHARAEGMMLRVVNSERKGAMTIAPRSLLLEIGGWKELNYVEDRHVWGLACKLGRYQWTIYPIYQSITQSRGKRGIIQRTRRVYGIMRDRARIGARRHSIWYTKPLLILALLSSRLSPSLKDPFFKDFWPDDPKYQVSLE